MVYIQSCTSRYPARVQLENTDANNEVNFVLCRVCVHTAVYTAVDPLPYVVRSQLDLPMCVHTAVVDSGVVLYMYYRGKALGRGFKSRGLL